MIDEQMLEDCCSLWRANGIGGITYRRIVEACGSPSHFFEASDAELRKRLGSDNEKKWRQWRSVRGEGAIDIAWLQSGEQRHILTWLSPDYPEQLKEIPDAPPLLYVCGNPAVLSTPQLAIVGSRHSGEYGMRNSRQFAYAMASAGMTITSGLALGIDGAAHQGALDSGGQTVAVVATGPDRVYPAKHHALATKIAASGAIVTEMPVGTPVRGYNFPRRNRIISGLSVGVLVIEASCQSGSLVTARLALEQGREVFAVPGSIHDPLAKGCHMLIRQGATLCEGVEDIVDTLKDMIGPINGTIRANHSLSDIASEGAVLWEKLPHHPFSVDELFALIELTYEEISAMLLSLELDGLVERLSDGRYRRLS